MGYTHYFNIRSEPPVGAYAKLAADARRLFEAAAEQGIELGDAFGEVADPGADEERIAFNGLGDLSHETFMITPTMRGFEFCKTARKPYDAVVCALLIRAKVHYGDAIAVSSDGNFDDEVSPHYLTWVQGRLLYGQVFGEDAVDPTSEMSDQEVFGS